MTSVRKYHSLRRNDFIGKHCLPVDYFFIDYHKKWPNPTIQNQVSNFYCLFLSLTFILYLDLFDFHDLIFTNIFFLFIFTAVISKAKRYRTRFTEEQDRRLRSEFASNPMASTEDLEELAEELDLPVEVVQSFFRNRRKEVRQMQRQRLLAEQPPVVQAPAQARAQVPEPAPAPEVAMVAPEVVIPVQQNQIIHDPIRERLRRELSEFLRFRD